MARRRHLLTLAAATAAVAVTAATLQPASVAGTPVEAAAPPVDRPTKVVVIVVDALSREIVDKYGMTNVQGLMADGVNARNSYLGHTGSVTVVTHNVITTGVLPKHMGWTDEGYRDVDDVLPDTHPTDPDLYITSDFGSTEMFALQNHAGYPKLADYLKTADPTAKTFTISPKGYAGWAFGGAGLGLDHHLQQRPGVHRPAAAGASPAASTCRRTSSVRRAAGSGCTAASRPTPTTPTSCRRSSTRSTATATSPARTRRTRAATSGRPTRRSR